jgi:hypothetical protein
MSIKYKFNSSKIFVQGILTAVAVAVAHGRQNVWRSHMEIALLGLASSEEYSPPSMLPSLTVVKTFGVHKLPITTD